jgi:cardiolipin synthase (CMP-forming)
MISNLVTLFRIALLVPFIWMMGTAGADARWGALAIFLVAGFSDILDGFLARRLNEMSAFGATLDLIADRLLTLVSLAALITTRSLPGWSIMAAMVLIGRDLIVASLNEALPGRLVTRGSLLEHTKIAAQFAGVAVLIAPPFGPPSWGDMERLTGAALLDVSALLALVTLVDYARRAAVAFRAGRP